jgi:hypothetical protein
MKTSYFSRTIGLALVAATLVTVSCKKKDTSSTPSPSTTSTTGSGKVITVKDSISTNTHWTADNKYLLVGYVYVTKGATLTIDPGTIIKGDRDTKGSLIVERGAKLMAVGTADKPIVFTSNQPKGQRNYGDWGGVILCGYAPVNWTAATTIDGKTLPSGVGQVEGGPRSLYGGNDAGDNSGDLEYVRIEFPGVPFSPNNEINGLTFCGIGSGTKIDHIQVSYSGDDSYEFFGGNVNCKHMVALRTWDDDFDTDNGFQGKVQFAVCLRDPYAADNSGSKGFESDSYQGGTNTTQLTKPVFSNVTLVGPLVDPGSTGYDHQFVAGVHIRRASSLSLFNGLVVGWPAGILIDEANPKYSSTIANIASGSLNIQNTTIAGTAAASFNKALVSVFDGARSLTSTAASDSTSATVNWLTMTNGKYAGPYSWFLDPAFHNHIMATAQALRLQNPFNLTQPSWLPTSTSPVVFPVASPALAASFSNTLVSDPFFDKVNFVGAFGATGNTQTDLWTEGWTNFDPQNTDY